MAVACCHIKALKELANLLAPGQSVSRINIDFPARGICRAVVEINAKAEDVEAILKAVNDVKPDVTIVPVADKGVEIGNPYGYST